jgi:hypothetical protein
MHAEPNRGGSDLPASARGASPGAQRPHQVRANGKAALVSEIDPELHADRYAALPNGCVVPAPSVAHRTDAILLPESFAVIPGKGIECPLMYDVVSDPMLLSDRTIASRAVIVGHLEKTGRLVSPMTREPIEPTGIMVHLGDDDAAPEIVKLPGAQVDYEGKPLPAKGKGKASAVRLWPDSWGESAPATSASAPRAARTVVPAPSFGIPQPLTPEQLERCFDGEPSSGAVALSSASIEGMLPLWRTKLAADEGLKGAVSLALARASDAHLLELQPRSDAPRAWPRDDTAAAARSRAVARQIASTVDARRAQVSVADAALFLPPAHRKAPGKSAVKRAAAHIDQLLPGRAPELRAKPHLRDALVEILAYAHEDGHITIEHTLRPGYPRFKAARAFAEQQLAALQAGPLGG